MSLMVGEMERAWRWRGRGGEVRWNYLCGWDICMLVRKMFG